MVHFEPLPLLEAHFFLAIRQSGDSVEKYFMRREAKVLPDDIPMDKYISILTELEGRLEACIEAEESEIAVLYNDLESESGGDFPSSNFLANLLVGEISMFCPESECFERMRSRIDEIPSRIAMRILGEWTRDSCTAGEATNIVLESKLGAESKLLLINLLNNAERFLDTLRRVLQPIAAEFERCGELIAPLLEHYRAVYGAVTTVADEAALLSSVTKQEFEYVKDYDIYPLVSCFNMMVFSFTDSKSEHVMMGVSTISDILKAYYRGVDSAAKVAGVLTVLGNRNRFEILLSLAGGRRYGREIAASLGITPASVSQHMEALLAAGLVKFDTSGKRVYYSLNHDYLRQFRDLFSRLLLGEGS